MERICKACDYHWNSRNTKRPLKCGNNKCQSHLWDLDICMKKCETCNKHFGRINLHHKNGNRKNNNKYNLLWLCSSCHATIHNGIAKSTSNYSDRGNGMYAYKKRPELKRKLLELRGIWLDR